MSPLTSPLPIELGLPIGGSSVIRELDAIKIRTRKAILLSMMLHCLLILALTMVRQLAPQPVVITEITWIDPEPATVSSAPEIPQPPAVKPEVVPPQPAQETRHFKRTTVLARKEPKPQDARATQDRLKERLATLQRRASEDAVNPALVASSRVTPPTPGLARAPEPAQGGPVALNREQSARSAPLELRREVAKPSVSAATVAPSPTPAPSRKIEKADAATARRTLAGATLVGPVADRKVLAYRSPAYPEWAKREAVEGSVRLYFVVLPGGAVKENVLIQKTSGYEDFDRNAIAALREWKFEPLKSASPGEQWGEITFHYRLGDPNAKQ